MMIVKLMTLYGLAGMISAVLAYVIALAKGREASSWAAWSFLLPPAMLLLLSLGRGDPTVRAQKKMANQLKAVLHDD